MYYGLVTGIERNIMCFDSEAPSGDITKRLIAVMKTVFVRNKIGSKITAIYIPEDSATVLYGVENFKMFEITEIFGASVIKTPLLNQDGPASKLWKAQNGCLGPNDTSLVMMFGEKDNECLLGSF